MPAFLLTVFLVALSLACAAVLIRLFVNVSRPFSSACRRAWIGAVVRCETSGLDRRYAALVAEHRRTP